MRQSRVKAVAEASACGLGFFSIALGVGELVAPRLVSNLMGLKVSDSTVRLYGLREIVTGVGILVAWNRAPWIWGRVAGDALDIASSRRPAAIGALAGVTALDIGTAVALQRERPFPGRVVDYSDRSGFPRPVEEMRGAAAKKERAQGPLFPETRAI
jgi:hypothetical protein